MEANSQIFEMDEMNVIKVDPSLGPAEVLAADGLFFLKDVAELLQLDKVQIKHLARNLQREGLSAWDVMGARKIWNHWILRMKVFAGYYEQHLKPRYLPMPKEWDGNRMLQEKGVFLLTEVCHKIPFSANQLRYQARRNPAAQEEYGIWKDEELEVYLVDMSRFAPWVRMLWSESFNRPSTKTKQGRPAKGTNKELVTKLDKPSKTKALTKAPGKRSKVAKRGTQAAPAK